MHIRWRKRKMMKIERKSREETPCETISNPLNLSMYVFMILNADYHIHMP